MKRDNGVFEKGILGLPRLNYTDIHSKQGIIDNVILGLPYDGGTPSLPGQRHLPEIVRKFSGDLGLEIKEDGSLQGGFDPVTAKPVLNGMRIYDIGDLGPIPRDISISHSAYLNSTRRSAKICCNLAKAPIFIGGDHSLTAPLTDGVRDAHQNSFDIIVLDAHCDTAEQTHIPENYKEVNHANIFSYVSKQDTESLITIIGVRTLLTSLHSPLPTNIVCHPVDKSVDYYTTQDRPVYLSIDLDVIDPQIFPATGHPEPGGYHFSDLLYLISSIIRKRKVIAVDLVEGCYETGQNEYTGRLVGNLITHILRELNTDKQRIQND